jgi:parallel beta-helix repeat protein
MFTGQMKDLLVWDVTLSPAQLDGVRLGGGLPSTPAPLVSMMRTWCGAAPPPSPPLLPPPPPWPPLTPPPSPPPYPPGTAAVSTAAGLTSSLANTAVGRIVLAPGIYYLTAELTVTRSVIIEAAVAGSVILNAQASSSSHRSVLNINPGSSGVVQVIGLSITGGYTTNGGGLRVGGGTVTLSSCTITGNTATNIDGGGVYIMGGTVTLSSCTITGNTATTFGAAAQPSGSSTIT